MAEKVIKKVVRLVVTKEDWTSNKNVREGRVVYTVSGEVRNVGFSEIKNAIVLGTIVNSKSNKTYQLVTRKFRIFKAADYTILPSLKPDESMPFEISVEFPPFNSLVLGKKMIKNLEDNIQKGEYQEKVFLIYDKNVLDETTQEWFKEELLNNLNFIRPKWSLVHNDAGKLTGFKCAASVKNGGFKEINKFEIFGTIEEAPTKPLTFHFLDETYRIIAKKEIDKVLPNNIKKFEFVCQIPPDEILLENNYTLEKLEEDFKSGQITPSLAASFIDDKKKHSVYRDTEEAASVIQELEGETEAEEFDIEWRNDDDNDEYVITGGARNTGARDIDALYVIASILNKKSEEPLVWETTTETFKSIEIEKISYLKKDDETEFRIRMNKPGKKSLEKNNIKAKTVEEGLRTEELVQKVELYYHKEDVYEEGIKRLKLGNSYFQLKNYRGCIREFLEGMKLIPKEKRFSFNLALCYYKIDKLDQAVNYCKRALTIDEGYVNAYYLMGLIYHSMKRYDDALDMYKLAHKNDKDNPKVLYNIGCIYFLKDNVREGIEWLRKGIKNDRTALISQMVRDTDLKKVKNTEEFNDFLQNIREEAFSD
ncbi:MAG: tetratricopeptide repeat protein [bacterium]|nr:tetratricopeptide repeat protein [bacterium]